ncbi:MAG: ABC transporter permease [Chloroflexi bacterium]|nr:ABC transporter permease [Chloroflexota bacterium]
MAKYLAQRLVGLLLVVLGVATVVFFAIRIAGDPVALLVGQNASAEDIERLRHSLGLDQPLLIQYVRFLQGAMTFDLGQSLRYRQPVVDLIAAALPTTVQLTVTAMVLAVIVALPTGILAALRPGSLVDLGAMSVAVVGQAMPVFWLGILLILVFSVGLRWFPTGGWGSPENFVLPTLALGTYATARISRLVRSGMVEVLSQDYIRTARSKGISEMRIVLRHALKNAAIPVVTVIALEFGALLGGAVITETIFAIPGLGRLAVSSVFSRDYPVVQGVVFVAAIAVSVVNLSVDLLYTYLDPRIRLSRES